MRVVNFIQSYGLQCHQFLWGVGGGVDAEYEDVLNHIDYPGAALKCVFFLVLRLEIEMFVNKKGKGMTELHDGKWLWDLTLLCGNSHHIGYTNTKLKGHINLFVMCLGLSEHLK
jgi:hypothetical protein